MFGPARIASAQVTIWTRLSVRGQLADWNICSRWRLSKANARPFRAALEMLSQWRGVQRMDTRIADRAIVTIEVMSWVGIIIAMGLILTVIAASIYGSLGIAH